MFRSTVISCLVVIVTINCAIKCQSASISYTERTTPLVEALSPRGIRVSIPDEQGIQLFAFHGKINSRIRRLETGTLSQDILKPANGRWVYENCDIQLRVGDIVNYWIFVQINEIGHRIDNLSYVITELIPVAENKVDYQRIVASSAYNAPHRYETTTQRTTTHYTTHRTPDWGTLHRTTQRPTATVPHAECECSREQLNYITNQLNVTLMQLNLLHSKMDPVSNQVESLKEVLQEMTKDMNIGTQLLLIGQQPPVGNPLEAIRSLITDKLELYDLDQKILHAQRTDKGLLFEMSSPIDKKRILHRANKLMTSNHQIIDPQDSAYIKGGAYQLDDRIS